MDKDELIGSTLPGVRGTSLSTRFLIASTILVVIMMTVLGLTIARQVEKATLRGAGMVGARYLQTFVAPMLRKDFFETKTISDEVKQSLQSLVGDGALGQHVHNIKIWRPDGTLAYNTSDINLETGGMFDELAEAFAGEVIVSKTDNEKHDYSDIKGDRLLIEVYAPLLRDDQGKVVLVGEFYEEPAYLEEPLRLAVMWAYAAIVAVAVPMIAILYLIVASGSRLIGRQQRRLITGVQRANRLSAQNNALRLAADQARLEAGEANERVLGEIGGELHDGPIQLLTLMKLHLSALSSRISLNPEDSNLQAKIAETLDRVIIDIRNLTAGLILPELQALSLAETANLAVLRFTDFTGVQVDNQITLEAIPVNLPAKICVYRFIQESLMNSFRHSVGSHCIVRMRIVGNQMVVSVGDWGGKRADAQSAQERRIKLGMLTQRRRIAAFGGRIRVFRKESCSIVSATLPIQQGNRIP